MAATNAKAGIYGQSRHLGEFSVDPGMLLVSVPPPPEDLNAEGKLWWNYYCGLMVEGNMLSRFFITSVHNLCTLHMLRAFYKAELNEAGSIIITGTKNVRGVEVDTTFVNPLVKDLRAVLIEMDKLLGSLGMTVPTSKTQNINTTGEGPRLRSKPPKPFSPEVDIGATEIYSMEDAS